MKVFVAILFVALVALGGGAIHLWRQLDANRQQIAVLKAQVDTTVASAPQAPAIAPSPSLPLAEPAAAAPPAASARGVDPRVLEEAERLQAMLAARRGPEFTAQTRAAMRRNIANRYPDVGEVLELSRDEVDHLIDLLYQQADFSADDAATVARMQQAAEDEMVSLLGSKYARWEEYKAEAPTRQHVKDMGAALDAAGTPLTDAQKNSLIKALAAEERRNSEMPGDRPRPAQNYRFTPEAARNLLNASSAYLTPQQMETYGQVLERASNREAETRNLRMQLEQNVETLHRGQQ